MNAIFHDIVLMTKKYLFNLGAIEVKFIRWITELYSRGKYVNVNFYCIQKDTQAW